MGAYENPPLLTPPNYGQIMMQNFWSMYKMTKELTAKPADPLKAAREKVGADWIKEAEKAVRDARKDSTYLDVNKMLRQEKRKINQYTQSYINGTISADEFDEFRYGSDELLNSLTGLNTALDGEIADLYELQKSNTISGYQPNSAYLGMLHAKKSGTLRVHQNKDGQIAGVSFMPVDEKGNYIEGADPVILSIEQLRTPGVNNINVSYASDFNEITKSLEKRHITDQLSDFDFTETIEEGGLKKTYKQKSYKDPNYNPVEAIMGDAQFNKPYEDEMTAGSIWHDVVMKKFGKDDIINAIKNDKNYLALNESDKEIMLQIANQGGYYDVNKNGEELSKKGAALEILNNVSRRLIAEDIVNNSQDKPKERQLTGTSPLKKEEEGIPEKEILAKGGWIYNPPKTSQSLQEIYGNKNIKYGNKTIIEIRPSSGYNINGKFPVDIYLGNEGEDVKDNAVPETIDLGNQLVQQKLLSKNKDLFSPELTDQILNKILGLDELPD